MNQPDMAFTGSAFPEPADQPATERAEITPATQHLHDTGFGPIAECGDEAVPSEWRVWAVLIVLNGLLGLGIYAAFKSIWQ